MMALVALIVTQWSYTSTAQNQLASTQWRLSSFGSSGSLTSVVKGTTITLKFGADGRASGSAGCNSYAADYRVQGENVSFSRILSTKKACLDQAANQQEVRYLAALEAAGKFQLGDDRLTIHYGDGGNILNFVNESAPPAAGRGGDSPLEVVSSFYDAVNAREYERAFRLWETAPGNFDDFVRGYSDTAMVQVLTAPKPSVEGAAGSLFAEIPTILVVRRRDGKQRLFAGCYVTRKSNIDTSSQNKGWRIYRAKFFPVSATPNIPTLLNQSCPN
jgi:heat shock protein HslJ